MARSVRPSVDTTVASRSRRSSARLSVGLLGPLSVTVDGREVAISGARRRDVLIRLALNEGRPLESGRLLEGDVPAGAANSLQAHVGYLRRQLGAGCGLGRQDRVTADRVDRLVGCEIVRRG